MKKNYLIIAFLFSAIMFGQTVFTNASGSGDGKWSTATNWTGGVLPTVSAQLNTNVNLDINVTLSSFLRSGTSNVSGTGKLTLTSTADAIGLLCNSSGFTYNAALDCSGTFVKALQVNNTSGAAYRQLTFGPLSVLTLTSPAKVVTAFDSKVVFQGKILGAGNLQLAGASEFATAADNTGFNGDFVYFTTGATIVSNTTVDGGFLKAGRKVQVNAASGNLTLNGANSCDGNIAISGANAFALNVNANQESFGNVIVGNNALTINVAAGVTNLSFANSASLVWGSGTVVITGYQSGEIRFGTTSTALTTTQLSRISADGTAAGKALTLDSNGYLVIAPTTWTGGTSTAWTTAANWSNGVPTATSVVTIGTGTFQPSVASSATINSLAINSGASLIVASNNLTVTNAIINNGTLTIQNNANLIQVNNVANTGSGTTTVNRTGGALKRLDYALWSSPVSGRRLIDFSSLTTPTRFYTYNPGNNRYTAATNTNTFTAATGYLIRMPDILADVEGANLTQYYLLNQTLSYPGVFTGSLNNGNYSVVTTPDTYNAVGNPYPSTISADSFITTNNITDGLYFWRKTNGASGTAYARYTALGGAGTTAGNGGITPNGTIQVGQGFVVKAPGTSLVFTNAMRLGTVSNQFFKTKAQAEKSRIWLNLNNAEGMINQTLVGYLEGATLGLDNGIDGKSFGDGEIELASNIDGENYTIQGRPAFDATDVVALNFKTSVTGTYTIAIDHVDGLFSNGQAVYLVDKTAGVTTNLSEGAYTFSANEGVDNTRFTLTYQKTLSVNAPLFNDNSVLVSRNNGTLTVKSSAVAINNVKVFDVQGRLVAERKNVKSNTASVSNLKANQVLIVKVTSENNAVVTKKVLN